MVCFVRFLCTSFSSEFEARRDLYMYKFPAGKLNIEVMCCFYPFYSHAVKTLSGKASEFMFLLSFSCAVKSNIYD